MRIETQVLKNKVFKTQGLKVYLIQIIMLNKYAAESKRKNLGLPPTIFAQAFPRTFENKIIRVIF